jgi:hypothetical protein
VHAQPLAGLRTVVDLVRVRLGPLARARPRCPYLAETVAVTRSSSLHVITTPTHANRARETHPEIGRDRPLSGIRFLTAASGPRADRSDLVDKLGVPPGGCTARWSRDRAAASWRKLPRSHRTAGALSPLFMGFRRTNTRLSLPLPTVVDAAGSSPATAKGWRGGQTSTAAGVGPITSDDPAEPLY